MSDVIRFYQVKRQTDILDNLFSDVKHETREREREDSGELSGMVSALSPVHLLIYWQKYFLHLQEKYF